MASGRLQIVDEGEVINGKPTIHLRGDLGQKATPPIGFWIDQTTNLPVRSEYQRGAERGVGSAVRSHSAAADRAEPGDAHRAVPDGFTQLPN
jgi:hypothetical protein